MRAVIVFESMYGNTHQVADSIAAGLSPAFEVEMVPAHDATDDLVAGAELLVVGGPTHVHGMSSTRTRAAALEAAQKDEDLEMDPDWEGPGLRDWFDSMERRGPTSAAAFDTRIDVSAVLSGRASKGIARRLRHHGFNVVRDPESFLVDKQNHLLDGEADRARRWGEELATLAVSASTQA